MMMRFSQARASSTVRPDLEKFIISSAIAAVTTAAMVEIVRICVYTSFMISLAFSHTVVAAKAGIVFAASIVALRKPAKRKRPQLIWRRSFRSFGFVVFS